MSLIAGAYGVERYQVVQTADWSEKWATAEVYSVEARAPGDAIPNFSQVRQMMQDGKFLLLIDKEEIVTCVFVKVTGERGYLADQRAEPTDRIEVDDVIRRLRVETTARQG